MQDTTDVVLETNSLKQSIEMKQVSNGDSKQNSVKNRGCLFTTHENINCTESSSLDTEAVRNNKNTKIKEVVKCVTIEDATDNTPPLMARALFDNIADSPEELAFRKGDILTVLEQSYENLEGWWLCSLRGRQGICPKNRLKLILPNYETCEITNGKLEFSSSRNSKDLNGHGRKLKNNQSNRDSLPVKSNDIFLYDTPPNNAISVTSLPIDKKQSNGATEIVSEHYDTPIKHSDINNISKYEVPKSSIDNSKQLVNNHSLEATVLSQTHESNDYDTPRSHQNVLNSSLIDNLTIEDPLNNSNGSSPGIPDYDIPRPQLPCKPVSSKSTETLCDESSVKKDTDESEIQNLLQNLYKYQNEVLKSSSILLESIKPHQQPHPSDAKFSLEKLKSALHYLIVINKDVLNKMEISNNHILRMKLSTSVNVLVETNAYIETVIKNENLDSWSNAISQRQCGSMDPLIKMVHSTIENIQETMTLMLQSIDSSKNIDTSAESLDSKQSVKSDDTSIRDYDYVNIQSNNNLFTDCKRANEPQTSFSSLHTSDTEKSDTILPNNLLTNVDDKELIKFYAATTIMCSSHLTQAIDSFLQSIEHNQPPKIFLANGKLVTLIGFRLMHIGNIICRSISPTDLRIRIQQYANLLNDSLMRMNLKTKQAALFFPSVPAVQEMVDSVVDISYFARKLKATAILCCQ